MIMEIDMKFEETSMMMMEIQTRTKMMQPNQLSFQALVEKSLTRSPYQITLKVLSSWVAQRGPGSVVLARSYHAVGVSLSRSCS